MKITGEVLSSPELQQKAEEGAELPGAASKLIETIGKEKELRTVPECAMLGRVLDFMATQLRGDLQQWNVGNPEPQLGDNKKSDVIIEKYRHLFGIVIGDTKRKITGYNYESVPGDGSCFYHAVARCVGGQIMSGLRKSVATYLEENRGTFQAQVEALYTGKSFESHIQEIRETDKCADETEVVAMMQVLDRPIVVIGSRDEIRNKLNLVGAGDPIFLYYTGGHYDALVLDGTKSAQTIFLEFKQKTEFLEIQRKIGSLREIVALADAIHTKSLELQQRGFEQESNFARKLSDSLVNSITAFCGKEIGDQKNIQLLKNECLNAISMARPILETHRGLWKVILANLVMAVLSLGVPYLLVCAGNKISGGNFFFFNRTRSGEILDNAESAVSNLVVGKRSG